MIPTAWMQQHYARPPNDLPVHHFKEKLKFSTSSFILLLLEPSKSDIVSCPSLRDIIFQLLGPAESKTSSYFSWSTELESATDVQYACLCSGFLGHYNGFHNSCPLLQFLSFQSLQSLKLFLVNQVFFYILFHIFHPKYCRCGSCRLKPPELLRQRPHHHS